MQKSTINLDDEKAKLKTKTTTSNLPTTTTTYRQQLTTQPDDEQLSGSNQEWLQREKQFCLLVKIIVNKKTAINLGYRGKKQQSMTYCFFLCSRGLMTSANAMTWRATSVDATDVTWQSDLHWCGGRSMSTSARKRKTAKTLLVNICKRKKLRAKAKWKRNKKTTLQKQKQFASRQPRNGCNAPDRNKK